MMPAILSAIEPAIMPAIGGMPMRTRSLKSRVRALYARLVAAGIVTGRYEPHVFESMRQDMNGSPVTALEQPAAWLLDMSRNLERWENIAPPINAEGWSLLGNSTEQWVMANGEASVLPGNNASRYLRIVGAPAAAGITYEIEWDNLETNGLTGVRVIQNTDNASLYTAASGRNQALLVGGGTSPTIIQFQAGADWEGKIGNISVREIPGNHFIQPTTANRPVVSARVNSILSSENFTTAAWTSGNAGTGVTPIRTANYAEAPDGTMTATRLQFNVGSGTTINDRSYIQQAVGNVAGSDRAARLWVKANTPDDVGKDVAVRFASGVDYTVPTLTADWQLLEMSGTSGTTSPTISIELRGARSTSETVDVLVWGADLRNPDQFIGLPPYQRVTSATDYDSKGFPVFLRSNGVNQGMYSAAPVDYSGTDKATLTVGMRKASDAAAGTVFEHGPNSSTVDGTFGLFAPNSGVNANLAWTARGTTTGASTLARAAPVTRVATGVMDISAPFRALILAGDTTSQSSGSLGSGNLTSQVQYLCRRGNSGVPFNGNFYCGFPVGAELDAEDLDLLKAYAAELAKGTP